LIDAGACAALVEVLKVAETDATRSAIAFSISSISEIENGRVALIDAGACAVLVEALKVAEINHTRCSISLAIGYLCWIEEGRVASIDAGACAALVEVLKVAETDATAKDLQASPPVYPTQRSVVHGTPVKREGEGRTKGGRRLTGDPVLPFRAHDDVVHVAHGFAVAGP